MQFIVKTTPEELQRARQWWRELEGQWKTAYNESVFGAGTSLEPPHDDHLMLLLLKVDTLRFAGPLAHHPNISVRLTNLSGLVPLYHLTYLSVTGCALTRIEELRRHTKLTSLFLNDNRLTSLDGIQGMSELRNLYFPGNKVKSLKPVERLRKLEVLYASNNELRSLDGLTAAHGDTVRRFHLMPNEGLRDRDMIRLQNEVGLIARPG